MTADRLTPTSAGLTRRDFARLAGLTGAAVALPGRARARDVRVTPRSWRLTGRALPGLGDFDSLVMAFMEERSITCGSLAIARDGRLLLARGYTWSAGEVPATEPASLFRTASVTKPVTAAAVLRLIEDGRLRPDDRAARLLDLSTATDPRLADVTVLRLLQHLGGWDREISGDLMFDDAAIATALGRRLPIGPGDIIRYAGTRSLDHAPGTAFAYSNYGYLLLGRIVEKVTGTAYERYVRDTVLAPIGITGMRLGRTRYRVPGEVPYFSQYDGPTVLDSSGTRTPAPYGSFNLENNAFNCGWLASAADLARFARIYDGATPVLGRASAVRAVAVPETGRDAHGRYYGCGWHVRPMGGGLVAWHSGSLPGTHGLLVRRQDGVAWAVLFDQRDDPSGESYREIDTALHEVAADVDPWPSGDLGRLPQKA